MGKRFFVVFGLFLIAPMLFAQKIRYLEGVVNLNAEPAQTEMQVAEGDVLATQKGRVEVELSGSLLWLNRYTQVGFPVLKEGSILVDIRYGEVYLDTEVPIEVKTPHKNFSLQGLYRVEVDRYKTREFKNPMLEDDFDKWVDRREKELAQIAEEEQLRYPEYRYSEYRYPEYNYWYYSWYPFGYYWTWYPYWYSWYWTGWYGYYPYYGYYYRDYYRYEQPRYGKTTIHKKQLKAPQVQTISPQKSTGRVTTESSRLTKKSVSRISMKTYPSRIRSTGQIKSRISSPQRTSVRNTTIRRNSYSPSSRYIRSSPTRISRPSLSSPRSTSYRSSPSFRSSSRSYSAPSRSISRSSSRSSFSRSSASRSSSSSSRGSSGSSRGSIRRK